MTEHWTFRSVCQQLYVHEKGSLTDITTCGDGIETAPVDSLHSGLEVLLDDTVELESLTGGQLEGRVSVLVTDLVHVEPLLRCTDTSG